MHESIKMLREWKNQIRYGSERRKEMRSGNNEKGWKSMAGRQRKNDGKKKNCCVLNEEFSSLYL